jgi:hypothetical protein
MYKNKVKERKANKGNLLRPTPRFKGHRNVAFFCVIYR